MQIALPASVLIVFPLVNNVHHVHNVQAVQADTFCLVLSVLTRVHMVTSVLTEFAKDVVHLVTIVPLL
jgi:hypothetical protein